MDLISNQFDSKEWRQWGQRRSKKIKLSSCITIILFCFIAYLPILKSDFLWNDYDQVIRSFFPSLNSWTEIFKPAILWNENPIALLSYFLETLLPFNDAFSHRLINIALHCFASVLLLKLLNKMHLSGAFSATLLCAVHPAVVQTLYFPGYRSIIIALCFLLLSLNYALDRGKKNSYTTAIMLSGISALIHPVALIIPLVLILRNFSKYGGFKLEKINKIVPFILIVFVLNIWSETAANNSLASIGIESLAKVAPESSAPSLSYQIFEYLKLIYLPTDRAFFIPVSEEAMSGNSFKINVLPVIFFAALYLFCIYFIARIWGRLLIMGLSLIIPLIIFAACQKGLFLDGSPALDEHLVYIALIPCVVVIFSGLNALFTFKLPQLRIIWLCIAWIVIICSTTLSFKKSLILSDSLSMWEYFEAQWPKSTIPKRAISDYLESSDSEIYNLKDQIRLVEFILEKEPNDSEKSILLARLYVNSGRDTDAIKQYKKVVSIVGESLPLILDEAADYFEAKGMYWDARKTRALLNKVE